MVFEKRYQDLTKCKWSCAVLAVALWGKAELWDGAGANQGQIRGGNGLSERKPSRILRRTQGETPSPAGKCLQCRWEREEPVAQCKNIFFFYHELVLKGIVYPKMEILWKCTHLQAIQDASLFLHQNRIWRNFALITCSQTRSFLLNKMLTDGLSRVDYLWIIVIFISCLDSRPTAHSLQWIHW